MAGISVMKLGTFSCPDTTRRLITDGTNDFSFEGVADQAYIICSRLITGTAFPTANDGSCELNAPVSSIGRLAGCYPEQRSAVSVGINTGGAIPTSNQSADEWWLDAGIIPDSDGTVELRLGLNSGTASASINDYSWMSWWEVAQGTNGYVMAADQSFSSTALADIDDGTNGAWDIAIGSSENIGFRGVLMVDPSSTSDDLKINMTRPLGCTGRMGCNNPRTNPAFDVADLGTALVIAAGTDSVLWFSGVAKNSTTAGDLTMQIALNSGSTTATLKAGSFMHWWEM